MAKKARRGRLPTAPSSTPAPAEAVERPSLQWRTIAIIVAAFLVLWVTAFGIQSASPESLVGYIMLGVVGVLTAVAVGYGIYIWRLTRRSQGIVDIIAQATDAEGRERAIKQLEEGDPDDAMNALARAQLVARDKPQQAMKILEGIDVAKAPIVVQDDVRANLGFLYLMNNRARDARALADEIRFDRQAHARAKAMYAAVVAEAFSRTGKAEEALRLIETYDPDDAEFRDVRPMLLRAQVFTYNANKKSGRAKDAMKRLGRTEPNMLLQFLMKGNRPQLQKMARQTLASLGIEPRQQMKIQRR